jgi:hypothetical protein
MGKPMRVCRVTMESCRGALRGGFRSMHACLEAYQLCIDDAARNRLIWVENSPLAEGLRRDISLVHKAITRLHGEDATDVVAHVRAA